MKKVVFFVLIFSPLFAWAQDFDTVVDFSVELSSLADRDRALEIADEGRTVILEGVIGDVMMADESPMMKLLGGEWIGSEEVRAYTCLFYLDDPIWRDVFPDERPDNPGSAYVPPGSRLLIAATVVGWSDIYNQPVAEILDYRVLK